MHFLRNHQENHKKSASYQQITTKSTVNYKLLSPCGPIPQNMARALMPRQPYSVAVLSTGGRLHPLPFWKGRGLGSGLRTLPLGRDRWGKYSTGGRLHPLVPEGFWLVHLEWVVTSIGLLNSYPNNDSAGCKLPTEAYNMSKFVFLLERFILKG